MTTGFTNRVDKGCKGTDKGCKGTDTGCEGMGTGRRSVSRAEERDIKVT